MRGTFRGALALLASSVAACGGHSPSIDDFLPELPAEDGPGGAYARQVGAPGDLLAGPAAQGLVGDTLIGNDRVRFVIQAPGRVIGVVPQGGNLIDGVAIDGAGAQRTPDHFGELAMNY